jgi:cell division protease FtsH
MNPPVRRRPNILMILIIAVAIIGLGAWLFTLFSSSGMKLTTKQFLDQIEAGNIEEVSLTHTGNDNPDWRDFEGAFINQVTYDGKIYSTFTYRLNTGDAALVEDIYSALQAEGIDYDKITYSSFDFWALVINFLPLILIVGLFIFFLRASSRGNNEAMSFGKSRAKLSREKTVTFKDVAGADEEKTELIEIIDFLKNPKKYGEMGAKIPKGVLLVGSPGTGKTLLAKATSGEAGVPFFSISGSDFVEMFVGVGASRVRDLFTQAKAAAPCIIFIDEIDAVGRQRGAGLGGGHDEREQTLNQLLVEMDGFNNNLGIIIMAATNRPDILDSALLRPGRFDRQITISLPDVLAREQILRVHARNKKMAADVKLDQVAARIPGFSGADIANVLNEAALLATRENRKEIITRDIDEAIDRVMMGPAKKSRKYSEEEKRRVAIHEAGHAVIGLKLKNAKIVQKVTIIPRGTAGGYNLLLDEKETFVKTKEQYLANITSYLGGRVAEEITFSSISDGAYGDITESTKIARAMVTEIGMSDLGPIQYDSKGHDVFLGRDYLAGNQNVSDKMAEKIDEEIHKIIMQCYAQAKDVISSNIDLLNNIANYLTDVETLNKADIDEILSTGKLAWWDDRKVKVEEDAVNENR